MREHRLFEIACLPPVRWALLAASATFNVVLFVRRASPASAVASLQRARSIDPTESSAAFNLGIELLRAGGCVSEALSHLRDASKLGHPRAEEAISQLQAEDPV
jgi:Flp pilus assembly protein TadD